MNAEEILQNASSWLDRHEATGVDTITNLIKEELDIPCDIETPYDTVYQTDPAATTILEQNETKVYTSLKPINFERFKSPEPILKTFGRLSMPLMKHVGEFNENTQRISAPNYRTPTKLGVPRQRRSSLSNFKKRRSLQYQEQCSQNNDNHLNSGDSDTANNDDSKDFSSNNPIEERDPLQMTPLRPIIKQQLTNSAIKDEKLLLTPQQHNRSDFESSDNEYEKLCDAIQRGEFVPSEFAFKSIQSPDIDTNPENSLNSTAEPLDNPEAPIVPEIETPPHDETTNDININTNDPENHTELNNLSAIQDTEVNNIDEQDPLQVTPLKAMNDEFNNSFEDKFFLTPLSASKRSICYDSEFERVRDSMKTHNPDTTDFSFETIELLNDFHDLNESMNQKVIAEILDSCSRDANRQEKFDEPTDPLAENNLNDKQTSNITNSITKKRHKKDTLNIERRKSLRLLEKSSVYTEEFDYIYDNINDEVYCSKRLQRLQDEKNTNEKNNIPKRRQTVVRTKKKRKIYKPRSKKYSDDNSSSESIFGVDLEDIEMKAKAAEKEFLTDKILAVSFNQDNLIIINKFSNGLTKLYL